MRVRLALGSLAAACVTVTALPAQSWRTLDVSRQRSDSSPASVQVTYGTGTFALRAATSPLLYHMDLRYDAESSRPRHTYDAETRKLQLGVQRADARFTDRERRESGYLRLALSRVAPLDLTLDLGAVEADLDLTGLRISRLHVESGASESNLRFDSLNTARMSVLEVSLGVASFRGQRLANANAADIRVDAGIGNVELDFGGQWTQDIALQVDATLGVVTVHVPADVGVRVSLRKVVASFDHDGLIERDGAWVSPNWESAPHKLRIAAETTFGKLTIDRAGR